MEFEVEIEKLVYGGRGLARAAGRVVLAPFVLPGEQARVAAQIESADLIQARTVEVQSKSPWRVEAPCPWFARCGGCHYQHIDYSQQLAWKRDILLETLARVGKIEWSQPVEILSADPWGYRNRTQLRVRKQGTRFQIGYFEHGSHRLCPIDACPISSPALNRAIGELLRMGPRRQFPDFLRELELFTNEQDLLLTVLESAQPVARRFFEWCAAEMEGFRRERFLEYPVDGNLYRVSSRSFFQVNRLLAGRLAGLALADHAGQTAVDLYAGVGLFSLPLAGRFERVLAVDSSASAIEDLEFNTRRAGVTVEAHHAPADRFLEGSSGPIDFLLADPPRAGLGRAVTASLARVRPRRLTVVSCDPATLARDLRPLVEAGFQILSLKLVDLFPQTFHIESVVELASG